MESITKKFIQDWRTSNNPQHPSATHVDTIYANPSITELNIVNGLYYSSVMKT